MRSCACRPTWRDLGTALSSLATISAGPALVVDSFTFLLGDPDLAAR
jgi:hypothetical protein